MPKISPESYLHLCFPTVERLHELAQEGARPKDAWLKLEFDHPQLEEDGPLDVTRAKLKNAVKQPAALVELFLRIARFKVIVQPVPLEMPWYGNGLDTLRPSQNPDRRKWADRMLDTHRTRSRPMAVHLLDVNDNPKTVSLQPDAHFSAENISIFIDNGVGDPEEVTTDGKTLAELHDAYAIHAGAPTPLDKVLGHYCETVTSNWGIARKSKNDRDWLRYYVPFHFSRRLAEPEAPDIEEALIRADHLLKREEVRYRRVAEDGDDERTELGKLFDLSENGRLCVTQAAGAGKSVFTRRLQAYLCDADETDWKKHFNGQPPLIVRWVRGDSKPWPDNFETGLQKQLAAEINKSLEETKQPLTSESIAKLALDHRRVVLILDALDQAGSHESTESLFRYLAGCDGEKCRVVMTGREYAASDHEHGLLADFTIARIEGFTVEQQYAYFRSEPAIVAEIDESEVESPEHRIRLMRHSLGRLFPNYDDVEDILSFPVVLKLVRQTSGESGSTVRFETGRIFTGKCMRS